MCLPLPYGDFKWVDPYSVDISNIADDDENGYIFEVDSHYLKHFHVSHKDLPLCLEHRILQISKTRNSKLLATLFSKERYIIQYRNLKQTLF